MLLREQQSTTRINPMHVHNFKYGHRGVLSHCDIKTGVMQRCNAPNPEWASVIRKAPLVVERDYDCTAKKGNQPDA